MMIAFEKLLEARDKIVDILKTARLLTAAVNRQRLTFESLHDEIRYDSAVMQAHARPVRVENAHNARVQSVKAMIRHRHGFGEALRLIVNTAWSDRIHVAPIVFALRSHQWIAVNFRRRR